MASEDGNKDRRVSVMTALDENVRHFDFYQAMRRIEGAHPNAPRLGEGRRPSLEPVRLAQDPELDFAGSNLTRVETTRTGKLRLFVRFLGLFGPNGPLPTHLTEHARNRERNHKDAAFARFVDLFHHRLLSMFYRAWRQAQPTASRDHPETDRFKDYAASLIGYGSPSLERTAGAQPSSAIRIADERRFFAGVLSRVSRNPEGLSAILSSVLCSPVNVNCFVPRWIQLPASERSYLGSRETSTLGESVVVGTRVFDVQSQIELTVGPVTLEKYRSFLPGAPGIDSVRRWLLTYCGDEYSAKLRPMLLAPEVPTVQLGAGHRLGYDSWLGRYQSSTPAQDLDLWVSSKAD